MRCRLAKVLGERIAKGAKRKGFGNGRECRVCLDECRSNQDARLGRLKLNGVILTESDYQIITRADSIGEVFIYTYIQHTYIHTYHFL